MIDCQNSQNDVTMKREGKRDGGGGGGRNQIKKRIIVISLFSFLLLLLCLFACVCVFFFFHLSSATTSSSSSSSSSSSLGWLLRQQFDRSGRAKSESLSGLEEVLACLQPSDFFDDQLSRYRGLCWADFLLMVQKQSASKGTQSSLLASGAAEDDASTSHQITQPLLPTNPSFSSSGRVLMRQTTQHDYSNRIKVSPFAIHPYFSTLIASRLFDSPPH